MRIVGNACTPRDPRMLPQRPCALAATIDQITYVTLAHENQVTLSAGRTGPCWDNALTKSFSYSLKGELIDTASGCLHLEQGRRRPGHSNRGRIMQVS